MARKYYKQMKQAEVEALTARIRKVASDVISSHAADRMAQKHIIAKEIENCLRWGSPLEIHNDADELRAVVRHAYGKPKVAVVVVIGLQSGTIVTTWKNAGSDGHSTLNMFAYQWTANIVDELAKLEAK